MEDRPPAKIPAVDTALISQYWDTAQRQDYVEPEKYLMLAVLKDALLDYQNNLARQNGRFKSARAWFFNESSNQLFSFETICLILNLSASFIRKELSAWQFDVRERDNITA